MLLGQPMAPSTVTGWRFVESDLHGIASRVMEYDRDARLIRSDESGQLGLARWQRTDLLCAGGYWALAKELFDLRTDEPLTGEPDGRVLQVQRASDSWGRNLREWYRKSQHSEWMREKHEQDDMYAANYLMAEKFVHALKKDVSAKPKAFVPRGI